MERDIRIFSKFWGDNVKNEEELESAELLTWRIIICS